MDAEQLRQLQAPLKQAYREAPHSALAVMVAEARVLPDRLACEVPTRAGTILAGLHPAAGGDGSQACSGDMLLQALAACSGVTLAAVATAMSIRLTTATVKAQAELDFRGTLGVDKTAPVGFQSIHLRIEIASPADDAQLAKLVQLTERYCVVLQTLVHTVRLSTDWTRST